jgi:anti-sigma B factor antagonist
VAATGEVDYGTAPELQAALDAALARGTDVVLDLRGVEFMDSTGVNLIVVALRRAQAAGRRFSVAHGPATWRTMRLVGLAGVVPVADPPP